VCPLAVILNCWLGEGFLFSDFGFGRFHGFSTTRRAVMKTMTFVLLLAIVLTACAPAPTPTPTPVPPTATPIPPPTPTPFTGSARVKLGDITMYFEVHGEGKPLILLHGALGSADVWSNQVPVFSLQYRVIALDSRGQGRTTDAEAPLGYHLMAEDTLRLMDYLGIDSAYVVGWSDGAVIGIDLAIHHPDRVKALVAYGANTSPEGLRADVIAYLRTASVADVDKDLVAEYSRLSPQPEHLPIIVEKLRTMALTQPNFTAEELAGIKVPTLILDGETEEEIRIDHVEAIAKAIPGATLIWLPGVGHYANIQTPNKWNSVVLDFLKDK
jgi:pimeloyl-ACP methyl ester carboxylesterase